MLSLFDLSGKTAVITGASRGLGKAMALALAEAGANIVITDVLDTKEAVEEIEKAGVKAMGMHLDVTSCKEIDTVIEKTVETFGQIDIFINNAGVYQPTPI